MIFIDSSFFKAFIDENDDFHSQAVYILKKIEDKKEYLLTSNYILDETITLIRVKCGVEKVRDMRDAMVDLKRLRVRRILSIDEKNAWGWFWNDWSKLSFTDCTSFAVMKRLGITDVASFDSHFTKAGFKVVK